MTQVDFGNAPAIVSEIERTWVNVSDEAKERMIYELRDLQHHDIEKLLAVEIAYLTDDIQHHIPQQVWRR